MRARELKAARKRLDLSQEKLADALDIHPITVSTYDLEVLPVPAWSPWPSPTRKPGRGVSVKRPEGQRCPVVL